MHVIHLFSVLLFLFSDFFCNINLGARPGSENFSVALMYFLGFVRRVLDDSIFLKG